jgi:2-dehydro-3-deoxygalactonokinase
LNTDKQITPEWVAVDWGTSNLRAWTIASDGAILDTLSSDDGMGALAPADFEPALLALIAGDIPPDSQTTIIASGMVGARQGWFEAPYATAPCTPPTVANAITAPTKDPRLLVHILPGVMQTKPADVMRGEETQIAGFLAANPDFDGVLCLPGTHSKWVRISAGEIVSFQTFMTGEIFALLANNSVLRHSVQSHDHDAAAFTAAVSDAISNPERTAARLFSIRAGSLVADLPAAQARATLSGLLIGMELAGARPYWLGMEVAIIGASSLARLYQTALADQGVTPTMTDADSLTLAGLTAAYNDWKNT